MGVPTMTINWISRRLSVWILLIVISFPEIIWAGQDLSQIARTSFQNTMQTQSSTGTNSVTPVGGVRDGAVTGSTTPTSSGTSTPKASSTPSINPSANQGQASQNMGKIINMAVGGAMMAACLASEPPNYPLCAMGALALAQGAMDGGAAGQSGKTASASYGTGLGSNAGSGSSGGGSGSTDPSNPNYGTGKGGFNDPKIKAGLKALKEAGYEVSSAGVKGPDGKTVPASAFGNAGAMTAAGMSPSAVKEALKVAAAMNDEISKLNGKMGSVGVAEGGGGGGSDGSSGNSSNSSTSSYRPSSANPFAINNGQKQQMVAGKTVLFDGEPIGVRGQDIFEMVHTAYEKKRQRSNFIEGGADGAPLRAPASTTPSRFK